MTDTPTFAITPGFLGVTANPDARIAIAGAPFDLGTTNRAGARFGPRAIRDASRMLVDGDHPTHWIGATALSIADVGDFEIVLGDIAGSLAVIEKQAVRFPHLVTLGGDHTVTLALLRAVAKRRGPVALLHFDAHVDTWPENFGQRYAHGSVFFHAIEEGLIDPRRTVQIGIRSPVEKSVTDWTREKGVTIVSAMEVHERGPQWTAGRICAVLGASATYLSFDIDALDPAFAPGTGTPEIGGLASWQAQAIIRRLAGVDFVGMDLMEVAPAYDVSEITALAGATMVWEYLALLQSRH